MLAILNPPFWISHFRHWNRNQRSFVRFDRKTSNLVKNARHIIRRFEFFIFDLEVVISDLKTPLIFIFVQF